MNLLDLRNILLQVGIPVGHYETKKEEFPRIVFQELSTSYDTASGKAYRENTRVDITHYTQTGLDPTLDKLKEILLKNNIGFNIVTAFDEDSKVIINQFDATITKSLGGNSFGRY